MRVIGVALAVCCGLSDTASSARQAMTGAKSSTGSSAKDSIQYDTGTMPKPAPGTSLRGAMVYVYSFLDVRTDDMGSRLVDEFNRQVVEALNGADVPTTFLAFRDAQIAGIESPSDKQHPLKWFPNLTESRTSVPVESVVAANASQEDAAGAKYRLIMFPNYMSQYAYWRTFDIDWKLIDVKTGKVIWVFSTTARSTGYGRPDKNARNRVASMMKTVLESLRKSRLIG